MKSELVNGALHISLEGRIDSGNAADTEAELGRIIEPNKGTPLVFDAQELEYISSAGLRVLLHIRKSNPDFKIINVNSDVYEIFDMTGFNQMMTIEKAYRVVSVEGCEEIGRGANGTIYRIDSDNVVKVYNNADALEDIQHEREVARLALVLGIPTAISYDVVKVGDSYGSVFELLNAKSFAHILATEPEKFDWCVREYVEMLIRIHETEVPEGKLPMVKKEFAERAERLRAYLPAEYGDKLCRLIDAVPDSNRMIHGDYHTKNLELQDDEVLLIDMDTLAVGNPVFELASMFNAFIGFHEMNHDGVVDFQGFSYDISERFWHDSLALYLDTKDESVIKKTEDKARIVGYTRLLARSAKRGLNESPEGKAEFEHWKSELVELLDGVDNLEVRMPERGAAAERHDELEIEASVDNLPEVLAFIDERLEALNCPPRAQMQIDVAVEEIFVNIAHYAYGKEKGMAKVRTEVSDDPLAVTITFIDHGMKYDPLAKEDPDVTLSAEERQIGGLGVFLVKNTMDDVAYEYVDGSNILKLKKSF